MTDAEAVEPAGHWWIATTFFADDADDEKAKVCGPFPTKAAALQVRESLERYLWARKIRKGTTFCVDWDPRTEAETTCGRHGYTYCTICSPSPAEAVEADKAVSSAGRTSRLRSARCSPPATQRTLTRTRPLPTQLPVPPGSGPTVTHRSEVSDMRRYWD